MTNAEIREKIVMALDDMKNKAIEMGIQGVATASVLNSGETDDWIGEMKVVGAPINQKEGWNLVAIAWSKCGEVIATGADSGQPDYQKMFGELGFVGGACDEHEGCKMAFAFSGADSEDDLVVAKYGIEKMKGDEEGMQTMRQLGLHMAFLIKSFRLGLQRFGSPKIHEELIETHFIR
jgi:hypothetical protein